MESRPGGARRAQSGVRPFTMLVLVALGVSVLAGSVGDPTPGGFIRFDDIRRDAFSAVAVQRHHADDSRPVPLAVRVNVIGDASDADVSAATEWLAREVNVRLVRDAAGVPLYLTNQNLIATSGPGALGATVRSGMAVEMIDERMAPCVLAHEVLHFLGLRHVDDADNLMYPRCAPHKLDRATLEPWQRAEIERLTTITAVTPAGVVTWAHRS